MGKAVLEGMATGGFRHLLAFHCDFDSVLEVFLVHVMVSRRRDLSHFDQNSADGKSGKRVIRDICVICGLRVGFPINLTADPPVPRLRRDRLRG
jgi:hypothetical protein